MKVKDLMQPDPLVAEVPGHRREVLRLLVTHSVSGLPVVKEKTRKLAGVVTRSDLFAKPEEEQLALIMSGNPHTVTPDDTLAHAARLFFEKRIHGLPVVEGDELVGVISPTDLLRVTQTKNRTVEDFLRNPVVPVWQDTPLPVVWQMMKLTRNNALPVMDDGAKLCGIVADSDLFKLSDVEESIGRRELGFHDEDLDESKIRDIAPLYYARSKLDLPRSPVREIMVKDVITVFHKTSAEEAAMKMAKARVNQLPVIDTNDRLVAIITDLDLMQAWFE